MVGTTFGRRFFGGDVDGSSAVMSAPKAVSRE
jgi:hypothetical protein